MEIFKDIPNYKGTYQVSNLGRVKSLEKRVKYRYGYRTRPERILAQPIHSSGYLVVCLCIKNRRSVVRVHQLVAIAFLNHTPGRLIVVDHIDNDKLNNRLDNLQVITQKENMNKLKGITKHKMCLYRA